MQPTMDGQQVQKSMAYFYGISGCVLCMLSFICASFLFCLLNTLYFAEHAQQRSPLPVKQQLSGHAKR